MKKVIHYSLPFMNRLITKIYFFVSFFFFLFPLSGKAAFEQHLTWKSEVEKINETEYNVKFICLLDDSWHVYSQFTDPGGPLPTEFRFEKNKNIEATGKSKEIGKVKKEFDELFGVNVASYFNNVTFVFKVKVKDPHAILKGEFDGQVCKDEVGCMPFGPEKFAITFDGSVILVSETKNQDTDASNALHSSIVSDTLLKSTDKNAVISVSKFDTTYANNSCNVIS